MEIKRIFDVLDNAKQNFADKEDILAGKENGEWRKYNIKEYSEFADNFSYGLLELGFMKGDKIATISNNRPEWNFVDMGMMQIGVAHVPIYSTLSKDEFKYVLTHCDAKILIVSNKGLYKRLSAICSEVPNIKQIYTFDNVLDAPHWTTITESGKKNAARYSDKFNKIKAGITSDDLATLIYTSGTTGLSKGVMLSHKNLLSNAMATADLNFLHEGQKALSFLPLSHVYERMVNIIYQYLGVSLYYAENLATIGDNIRELKVDGFVTVPRVMENVFDKILAAGKKLSGFKRFIFHWALKLAYKYELPEESGLLYRLQHKLADKLVYNKWREAVGGRISFIACGGAALQPRLEKIFWAAGIPLYQGYGLSETSPIIAVNYGGKRVYSNTKFGTVGPILKNIKVKLSDEGEILCHGPSVMQGYYKAPQMTNEVIIDNWFHTGDIGVIDEKGFLTITDRKKEIFKMSSGKYIAPQRIENKLKESFFIDQLIVIGENKKFASAIISPNFSFLHDWAYRHKIHFRDNKELIKKDEVKKRFQKEIDKHNIELGQTEKIKKFRLVCDEWTPMTGELSPTLKLKRRYLLKKYSKLAKEMYPPDKNNGL